jgi:hypothetical protein
MDMKISKEEYMFEVQQRQGYRNRAAGVVHRAAPASKLAALVRLTDEARLVGCHRVGKWALPFTTLFSKGSIKQPPLADEERVRMSRG